MLGLASRVEAAKSQGDGLFHQGRRAVLLPGRPVQNFGDPHPVRGSHEVVVLHRCSPRSRHRSALLRGLGIKSGERPGDLFTPALRTLGFGDLVLGQALTLLEPLTALLAPILVNWHGSLPACFASSAIIPRSQSERRPLKNCTAAFSCYRAGLRRLRGIPPCRSSLASRPLGSSRISN